MDYKGFLKLIHELDLENINSNQQVECTNWGASLAPAGHSPNRWPKITIDYVALICIHCITNQIDGVKYEYSYFRSAA
jgi:hypothetical protein